MAQPQADEINRDPPPPEGLSEFERFIWTSFGEGKMTFRGARVLRGLSIRKRVLPVRLDRWIEFEAFTKEQVAPLEIEGNIKNLECKRLPREGQDDYITFEGSRFDQFSDSLKLLYNPLKELVDHPERYLEKKKLPSIGLVIKAPGVYSLPYYLVSWKSVLIEKISKEYNLEAAREIPIDELFSGLADETIQDYTRKHPEKFTRLFAEAETIRELLSIADAGQVVCFIQLCSHKVSLEDGRRIDVFHAIAGALRNQADGYHLYLYDPMYYVKGDADYSWALKTTYIQWKVHMTQIPGAQLQIHSLSELCVREERGGEPVHRCVQYKIDAEYCLIYSLYFLYSFCKRGMPIDTDGLRACITETYIVDPRELVRNPCKATNLFRLRFISFLITAFLFYAESPEVYRDIIKLHNSIKATYGLDLLHPILRSILEISIRYYVAGGSFGADSAPRFLTDAPAAVEAAPRTARENVRKSRRRQKHLRKSRRI